tara:strand:+ start:660 stop:1109 length:450 start_codon:yes stop_codon:yes gene_type:complete
MNKHTESKLKKEIKVNDELEFPDLSTPVVEKKVILDYKNMKEIEEQKEKVKEGWVKIYYKDNKIIKEYGKVSHKKIKKIKQEKNYQNEVQEVIKSMITRWENEDKLKENEIDYYHYYDENEYETEDEYELQEQDMNGELIEDLLNEDKF